MPRIQLVAVVVLSTVACSGVPVLTPRRDAALACDISMQEAFANPVASFGRVACGSVVAVHEGSSIRMFYSESGEAPAQRHDLVLIPDSATQTALQGRITEDAAAVVYIRGELSGDARCFEHSEIRCLPFRRPFFIRVIEYSWTASE